MSRRATLGAIAGAGALLATQRAGAVTPHEVYGFLGGEYYSSPARVLAGLGGGVGYRFYATEALTLHAEARWLLFVGNAFSAAIGGTYALRFGAWRPAVGLQIVAYLGDQITVLTPANPQAPTPIAWSVQARFAPLRFTQGAFTVSALVLDVGGGYDGGGFATAIGASIGEMGLRF
jgi:hypothetical protein